MKLTDFIFKLCTHKCISYWFLNTTTVFHSKHAANMFHLSKTLQNFIQNRGCLDKEEDICS